MAGVIASIMTTAQFSPEVYAVYLDSFLKEIDCPDYKIYKDYGINETLPIHQYGDTSVTGDTGGDAARASGLYKGENDGFKVTGWDNLGYFMNYGFTVDDINDTSYGTDLDYNFTDFEIVEGTGYDNGTNYRYHDKALTNKFYVNIPIVRYGATNQYDTLGYDLISTSDVEQVLKQFGYQAKMVEAQYIRATMLNEATPSAAITFTDGGSTAEQDAFIKFLKDTRTELELKDGQPFAGDQLASDGVGTQPVRGGFIAIIHPLMKSVIEDLPGFVHYTEYGTQAGLLPNEFGTIKDTEIRFVTNTIIVRQSGTSAVGIVDAMTGSTLTEYNMIVMAKDAYTVASLSGNKQYELFIQESGQGSDVLHLEKNMGWKSMIGCKVTRPAWMFNKPITFAVTP